MLLRRALADRPRSKYSDKIIWVFVQTPTTELMLNKNVHYWFHCSVVLPAHEQKVLLKLEKSGIDGEGNHVLVTLNISKQNLTQRRAFSAHSARSRQRNGLVRLQQWPHYLQGPGFDSHLRLVKFSACKKGSQSKKLNLYATICAMCPNNLAQKSIRGICKTPN